MENTKSKFPSSRTDDMCDSMKPLLQKLRDYIVLHIGTNDALDNTSREILDKIHKLKTYIQKEVPKFKITISALTRKATGFKSLQLNCWEINQITPKCQIDF